MLGMQITGFGIPIGAPVFDEVVRQRARYLASVRPDRYRYDNDSILWMRNVHYDDPAYIVVEQWTHTGRVEHEAVGALLQAAEEGQLPLPDEDTKNQAFHLRNIYTPGKQIYLTTEEDYALWLKTPKAPTPGS
jgi:hypothetical protein